MIGLIIFAVGLIGIAVISLIVYFIAKIIFDRKMNTMLEKGDTPQPQKKMVHPTAIALVVAGILIVMLLGVSCLSISFEAIRDTGSVVVEESMRDDSAGNQTIETWIVSGTDYTPDTDGYSLMQTSTVPECADIFFYQLAGEDQGMDPLFKIVIHYLSDKPIDTAETEFRRGEFAFSAAMQIDEDDDPEATDGYIVCYQLSGEINSIDYGLLTVTLTGEDSEEIFTESFQSGVK